MGSRVFNVPLQAYSTLVSDLDFIRTTPFHTNSNLAIGSTGVTLEAYSRGIYVGYSGTGCLIAAGYGATLYVAFMSDSVWRNAKKIVWDDVAKVYSTTVTLSNKNVAARVRKEGHIVTINSPEDFTSTVGTTLTKIGTLPNGYIPAEYFRVPLSNVSLSGGDLAFIEIRGSVSPDPGGIYYYYPRASTGATNGSFFASYFVD